jgi:hypothetical protein
MNVYAAVFCDCLLNLEIISPTKQKQKNKTQESDEAYCGEFVHCTYIGLPDAFQHQFKGSIRQKIEDVCATYVFKSIIKPIYHLSGFFSHTHKNTYDAQY